MAQNPTQVTTTPPLPGLQLVSAINKALETVASDFAGPNDPAAIAWPYAVWADTSTQTIKRRNATNDAWVIEGSLLQRATFALPQAQILALASDQGPIVCSDVYGGVYVWNGTKYTPALTMESQTQRAINGRSATFTKSTNVINSTAIVTMLELEAGDVIKITGTASNNLLMTVESITDASTIVVNYMHRNGAGPLSLTTETASAAGFTRIAKWYQAALGLGQDWCPVTRAQDTWVLNTTQRTIAAAGIQDSSAGASVIIYVGNTHLQNGGSGMPASTFPSAMHLVPPGGKHYFSWSGPTPLMWELR